MVELSEDGASNKMINILPIGPAAHKILLDVFPITHLTKINLPAWTNAGKSFMLVVKQKRTLDKLRLIFFEREWKKISDSFGMRSITWMRGVKFIGRRTALLIILI